MRIPIRIAAASLGLVLTAAACGGSGDDTSAGDDIRTLETTAADAASGDELALDASSQSLEAADGDATEETDEERTFEDAQLDYASCMRENGFPEWPDPDPDAEGGGFRVDLEALGIDRNDATFTEARDACRGEFEGVAGGRDDLDPEQQAELEDQMLALFACVRQNPGWEDLPDPDFSENAGPGGGLRELFTDGSLDPQEFRTLSQECQTELGIEGAGLGAGRGPGAGGAGPGAGAGAGG